MHKKSRDVYKSFENLNGDNGRSICLSNFDFDYRVRWNIQVILMRETTQVWTERNHAHLVSLCEQLGMTCKESRILKQATVAIDIPVLWGNSYLDVSITKIEAVIKYGACAHNCPKVIWDFPFVIQMDILNEFLQLQYSQCLCMHVEYNEMQL